MQCFTLPSLFPKTSLSCDYPAPLPHQYYDQKAHYIPEPDKNGRMGNPDAFMPPLPFNKKAMTYEPVNSRHRNTKMVEMLEHINKVNWTTSRDSRVRAWRETTVMTDTAEFRHSSKMPTVTHTTYVDHGPQIVDRKFITNVAATGITPCTYPLPHSKERCVTADRKMGCLPARQKDIPYDYEALTLVQGNAQQYRYVKKL